MTKAICFFVSQIGQATRRISNKQKAKSGKMCYEKFYDFKRIILVQKYTFLICSPPPNKVVVRAPYVGF